MNWLRTIYQKLSYKLGFARGLRGRPFALSWWADMTTYGSCLACHLGPRPRM